MIGCPCLCTGADSTNGIDSTLGTDSSPGIDSILEPIPCDSDSGSFGYDSISAVPVTETCAIITPLKCSFFETVAKGPKARGIEGRNIDD